MLTAVHRVTTLLATACLTVLWIWGANAASAQQASAAERAGQERERSEKLASANELPAAIEAATRAADLLSTVHGADSLEVAEARNWLGQLHFMSGDFRGAERSMREALTIRERLLKPDDPLVAQSLNNVATVLGRQGDLVRAEEMLVRALDVYRRALGPDHLDVARALINLARMYNERGDLERAEARYGEAVRIVEKAGGNDILLAQLLNNLGILYQDRGDLERAREALERSLKIRQAALKPTDLQIALAMGNLASVHQERGALDDSARLYESALAMYDASGAGAQHPNAATFANNLAMVWLLKEEYDKARPLYMRALETRRARLGPSHPQVAKTLETLGVFHQVVGEERDAVARMSEAAAIVEANLRTIITAGSEQQKTAYMSTLEENTDITISLCRSLPHDRDCARLAAELVIQRKARVLDALMTTSAGLRSRLDRAEQEILDQLSAARTKLTALLLSPGARDVAKDVSSTAAEIDRLEAAASARGGGLADQLRDVRLGAAQEVIPADTAVLEFIRYRPFDPRAIGRDRRFAPPRYAAFVLRGSGEPQWFDLGLVSEVDAMIAAWRSAIVARSTAEERRLGRELNDRLLPGVDGTTKRLLLVPDGTLNLVPFAALRDSGNRYRLERYEFVYLGSSRDLFRGSDAPAPKSGPVILAAPAFGSGGRTAPGIPRFAFTELPGAADEGRRVAALLPQSQFLTGSAATEGTVKRLQGPVVLHLATHGFFLSGLAPGETASSGVERGLKSPTASGSILASRFALIRSGIALAGANHDGDGTDDGVLTALEASSLNLLGTRLVVLSACETGLGEVRAGDGVHGLRRALQIAGARTQVMSLWRVADEATRDLMVDYYGRLREETGTAEALRAVQLTMLKGKYPDPIHWAAFIPAGDWGSLRLH